MDATAGLALLVNFFDDEKVKAESVLTASVTPCSERNPSSVLRLIEFVRNIQFR